MPGKSFLEARPAGPAGTGPAT